ncbi:Maleylacetate reductase [Novosphingobium sp. AAP83]|uniref:maleylacetate reductase n=1 Tax=Novosphingobium sp. AAP83 TaxID=1523425 RepID=UPI0006B97597|nr:maleylacetate reductase [Novosphingobium sp. AAP83]KPF92403.1 Maleylacetate reductase [Novosphingobium sp. AAP83]
MRDFIYNSHPGRILFGQGRIAGLAGELERLGANRVLAISTSEQAQMAQRVAVLSDGRCVATYTGAAMHTPVEVTEAAMEVVRAQDVDALVAIGGGSTIGLAKAIALRTDLPQIAIPTTYAGSEMTPIIGETSNGAKVTQTTPKVLPEVVIYDVDLTLTLPPRASGTSGINAIAHAVEALYARDRNPIISLMAAEGIRALSAALPAIARDPLDLAAREKAQYGAWLCGTCLGAVGMALHHKLCHTLGGSFNLPHAETHTIVLPHALAYNAPAIPEAMAVLRDATGSDDPVMAIYRLAQAVGAPLGLSEIGMAERDVGEAVRTAMGKPYWNPRPLEAEALHSTLSRAWSGAIPQTP